MIATASGYRVDVSRGPNWLFLKLDSGRASQELHLASDLWSIVSKHFIYRVVLEFGDGFDRLSDELIAQLDAFRQQLELHDGALRVCGLNPSCARRLSARCSETKTQSRLTSNSSRACAVFGTEDFSTVVTTQPAKPSTAYEAQQVH